MARATRITKRKVKIKEVTRCANCGKFAKKKKK